MKYIKIFFPLIVSFMIIECGNPGVNVNNAPYEPKITVEGYLYCGESVHDIKLMRNYALGAPVDQSQLYLTPSLNSVSITINGNPLTFDPQTDSYYNSQMYVDYGKTYTLEVFATIDGKKLHTTSTTTTPQKGFTVLDKNLGQFKYNTNPITITFNTSPGTGFYVFSIVPDSASLSNFIYNNVFRSNLDSAKIANNFNDYKFRHETLNNINSFTSTAYSITLNVRDTWFYSSYTVIAYAGDENFKDYLITAPSVQEFDGNFHQPVQIFNGDGIGVFASAIKDTVRFSITK
ncbi:MAG: DUF4249 domain-containing protein [Ignavibacteriaceae bacterium]